MVRPVLVLALLAIAAPARASELSRRMGMYPTQGGAPLAMLDSKLDVRVRGPIVEATITQTFRNELDRVTEATYIFPLPSDAAVSAMAIAYGSRTIHAAIARREDAQQRYEQAVAAGLGAGILEQERPDVFTQTVSAIPAHGSVTVVLRFDATARYQDGTWELDLPLVIAPRYVPGSATGRPTTGTGRAPDTDRAPDASRVTPGGAPKLGGATEVIVELADADDVTSPTHELVKTDRGYAFTDPHSDHDAVLRWKARVPAAGWVEQDGDGGYAAMIVEAPAAAARTADLRLTLVLDRAATMRGDADAVAHPLVRALAGSLTAKDSLAVTGSDVVDARAPADALRALDERWSKPAGAFDLTRVLEKTRGAAIVLVSDGLVADDAAAIAAAKKLGTPIHVIGIGPAPNRSLLEAIAVATGGTARFAQLGDDVAAIARDLLADVASPPAPLAVTWGTLAASDVVPGRLPRLGAGQATLVVARVKRAQTANARVRGDVFAFTVVPSPHALEGATTPGGALARRWARIKLDELIAAGNPRAIAEHALRYGLVSPATSMIAVGDEVVVQGGVKHTVPVPVSVPAGMRWQEVKQQVTVDTTTTSIEQQDVGKRGGKSTEEEGRKLTKEAPAKHKSDKSAARGDDEDAAEAPSADLVPRAAPAPTVATGESAGAREYEDAVQVSEVQPRRAVRLAAALGAGLALEHGQTSGLGAVSVRAETNSRTLFGAEASLWLVGGLHAQGEVLATVARRGIGHWLELGAGFGLHLGDGVGPALDLTLRTRLPARHLALYLRYDGALLFHDATRDGQNAGSLGVEARW